ncbi:MAG: acetyl-CoA carboxylase, carboxyltransferase subunit beta [Pseudomonadota bacterium]
MNWISDYVRPKIRALVGSTDVPDNLWTKCPNCGAMLFHRDLERSQRVCGSCDHHLRVDVVERLAQLFDEGQYTLREPPGAPVDPLKFRDTKRYVDRLKDAQAKTKRKEAMLAAEGRIGGSPAVIAAFDFSYLGGSMGVGVGEVFLDAAARAVETRSGLILIAASGGARMQEGALSLMQMPRTVIAVQQLREAGLPYIVVLTDPTTGGVSASLAMLGDVTVAEPGALIGFAGQRVIEETIREELPEGFQRAEYLADHGMVDVVAPRHELPATLARLLDLMTTPHRSHAAALPPPDAAEAPDAPAETAD